jgi:hypothetical protein
LALFDFKSLKWSPLVNYAENPFVSPDGKYIYFERSVGSGRQAFRVGIPDRREQPVADLSGVRRVEQFGPGTWLGVGTDGSLLITRDVGTQEIYALDIKW